MKFRQINIESMFFTIFQVASKIVLFCLSCCGTLQDWFSALLYIGI